MCHVSHLTDALLGVAVPGLAVRVTARLSAGLGFFCTDAKSCCYSFPVSLSGALLQSRR